MLTCIEYSSNLKNIEIYLIFRYLLNHIHILNYTLLSEVKRFNFKKTNNSLKEYNLFQHKNKM